MTFLNLPEDVLHDVLCLSDIYSVISISQTNKYLHDLASTPTIWIFLVEDLRNRGFIDRLSAADIRSMSTQSLVAIVRRLVIGPEAWSPSARPKFFSKILQKLASRGRAADPPPAQPYTQILLHAPIDFRLPCRDFKLLPGGKYILFCSKNAQDLTDLGCWRVADDSFVGTYHSGLPSPHICSFEAEVLPGGERANIVMCVRTGTINTSFMLQVIKWDFTTGVTELLSSTECIGFKVKVASQYRPKICSGITAARCYQSNLYVIIDWHEQQYCKILCSPDHDESIPRMELIPGHLIFTWTVGMTQKIQVIAIASLSGLWTPVVQQNMVDPVLLSTIPHVASHTITSKSGITSREVTLAVHESPLQCGTYRVWIYIPYSEPRGLGGSTHRALMCRFRLSLPSISSRQLAWLQQSCAPAAAPVLACWGMLAISYSGHTKAQLWGRESQRIFPPDIHSAPLILKIPEYSRSDITPYSGTVGYTAGNTVGYVPGDTFVLSYFE
ncbi:hypothetical protein C8R44DRAFT_849458 [Mycena epipterygia]|nr:hypothetical protein C8R44DRAFT_849458 [Mycena epipterygia]